MELGFVEELRREEAKAAAEDFVRACQTGDVAAFDAAVHRIYDVPTGAWWAAMRAVVKQVQAVSPDIQQAFLSVWIESKRLPREVDDHRTMCAAARVLLPRYQGPAVRLFRGAWIGERRRRIYGLSWTAEVSEAERFARDRQGWEGGSVVLETLTLPMRLSARLTILNRLPSRN